MPPQSFADRPDKYRRRPESYDISTGRSRTVLAGGCAVLGHTFLRPRECEAGLKQDTLSPKGCGEVHAERRPVDRRAFGKPEQVFRRIGRKMQRPSPQFREARQSRINDTALHAKRMIYDGVSYRNERQIRYLRGECARPEAVGPLPLCVSTSSRRGRPT